MVQSNPQINQIRNLLIKGTVYEFLPLIAIGTNEAFFDSLPQTIQGSIALMALGLIFYGYIVCWRCAYKYAKYKGYPGYFGWLGIFNIFGLSFLLLLKNKKQSELAASNNPFENFSFSYIFLVLMAISILYIPFNFLIILVAKYTAFFKEVPLNELLENEDFSQITGLWFYIILIFYIYREIQRVKINTKQLMGNLKNIDFKLPIGLAIVEYFFAFGVNRITLYCLSFIVPEYVYNQINQEYVETIFGWIAFSIGILIIAPIMEESLLRGIVFQKLAIKNNNIVQALLISAFIFTIIHVRYDVIFLFIVGAITVILYLKTKRLIVPMINHFSYNLIVLLRSLQNKYFTDTDASMPTTIIEYQQYFEKNLGTTMLILLASTSVLAYFIYKNFPRNYTIDKLPYFANQINDRVQ
jgi:uncharacterized protein